MKIFGAGLSGLIAGCIFPKAKIYERSKAPFNSHEALLRFRTNKVSEITGIPFKKVNVLKSIWSEGKDVTPTPRLVAMYSKKVTGKLENRSIIDISTTNRYIAPDDFYDRLIDINKENIIFGYEIKKVDFQTNLPIISTLPLSVNSKMLGYEFETSKDISSIYITKLRIANCDMYSTIYYPDNDTPIYRASITKDILIIESKKELELKTHWFEIINDSFGLQNMQMTYIINDHRQTLGKITKINDSERRVQIYKQSHDHSVYSLGRYALHKSGILLDDVAKDVFVIKSMINDDSYGISTRNRI